MKKKFLSLPKLAVFLDRCNELFARKTIENRITNSEISTARPESQEIGDIWFVETERESESE